MTAREAILGRIRAATKPATEAPAPRRSYLLSSGLPSGQIDLLVEMLREYGVRVHRTSEARLADDIRQACNRHGVKIALVPSGLPGDLLAANVDLLTDDGTTATLTQAGCVVTTCALAIAQTGTIVLDGGPGQGRRALTLIPDYHLCIIEAGQVVSSVPEAVERLEPSVVAGLPLTFISGPSATSDIELTRVEGVHGPRNLEVFIVE